MNKLNDHRKWFFRKTGAALCMAAFFCLAAAASAPAEIRELTENELSDVYCQGATNIYIEENTVRVFLDMHMETYGEIDSVKAAHYEKDGASGWDIDWTAMTLGEAMDIPLITDGLVIRTEFDDIDSNDKKLKRIIIGSNNMNGRISGEFTTSTGAVHPEVVGDTGTDPIVMNRGAELQAYEHLDIADNGFFIDINFDGQSPERGIKTIIGYQESQAIAFTFDGTDWWNE